MRTHSLHLKKSGTVAVAYTQSAKKGAQADLSHQDVAVTYSASATAGEQLLGTELG